MAKKCKCPEGVPEWVVTFGDMMSLLLCFFILLAAFSEPKKDREFQDVVQAIQEAFGYTGGSGHVPTEDSPTTSIIKQIEAIALHRNQHRQISNSDDPGVEGKDDTVSRVREGAQFIVGGPVRFDVGSAELTGQAEAQLLHIAQSLRGKNNKIEIRGHASGDDLARGVSEDAYWKLSNERALAVMNFLIDPRRGIRPERVRIVACSHHEPVESRAYDLLLQANNRRVEIIEIEALVQDFDDSDAPTPAVDASDSRYDRLSERPEPNHGR